MGYLIDFEIYQGKSVTPDVDIERNFVKAAAPLVKMIEELPNNLKPLQFSFYFDNLFTTFSLLTYLRLKGYGGTGTIRENRLPKSCPLSDKKLLGKKDRGYFENTISETDGILVAKWVDNSVVCIATNQYGIHPVTNVRRYSQKEKKHIQVNRPALLAEYNKKMGGTDRMDQNVGQYRIQIRNRKCTLKNKLITKPVVALYDPNTETEVHTDASKLGVGARLLQRHHNPLKHVKYFAKLAKRNSDIIVLN
ncbi:piggyBac transposable element-derived protein 3-like [Anoplophora glabripennis]|uniref:piggyBac transposable element-derived protein 3-like n=1 Tax=Anoplophora glabripennis TaxID=217634 RepID=UPI00087399A0|nr:piggyBac transposable element-derived protein 3-like [Anoplophora glabripennis]